VRSGAAQRPALRCRAAALAARHWRVACSRHERQRGRSG
jgi:hypothetical protein